MSSEQRDPYAPIADWYDLEHDSLTADSEMYQELLMSQGAKRLSVLEIGAGTGRLAAALALAGCAVVGVEPSAAMRAKAAKRMSALPERVTGRIRMVDGTATKPNLRSDERFDAVIIGLGTFAHLTTAEERDRALAIVLERLRPQGYALIDLDLAGPRRFAESAGRVWSLGTWRLPNSESYLTHLAVGSPGTEPGTVQVAHFYDVYEQSGSVKRTFATTTFALLSVGEVELALRYAGFTVTATYGSYDLAPYDESASRSIFVAQRSAS